jgi:hypothetical protein
MDDDVDINADGYLLRMVAGHMVTCASGAGYFRFRENEPNCVPCRPGFFSRIDDLEKIWNEYPLKCTPCASNYL